MKQSRIPTLDIYIDADCSACETARSLAYEVRLRMPHVIVRLRDITQYQPLPEAVFAVPTYMLNGRRISLGNPSLNDLLRQLQV